MRVALSSALALTVLAGCVDEKIVFRDRELFEEPVAAAEGFLGYNEVETKSTVCGECHVGQQAGWLTTGHSDAWATLQESGHAQEFCEGCHTVNQLGNELTEAAGYLAVAEERYHDVGCESCHGPGLQHVQNPDASQPLASLVVGLDLTNGCGECHQGSHHPFVEQWAESAHGELPNGSYAGLRDGCNACHNGLAALRATFKEDANFVEDDEELLPITCAVCHDPHGSQFAANLRAPIDEPSEENLCVQCHARRASPTSWSAHGPHAPQGNLVLSLNAGWIPPGFQYDTLSIISSHGSEANPSLCATCHVAQITVEDQITGEPFTSVGHLFEAAPCIDPETGLPVAGPCDVTEKRFDAGCVASGCHGSAETARSAYIATRTRIDRLLDELWEDADGDHALEVGEPGLLPQVLATAGFAELDPADRGMTVAKGAIWNALLAFTSTRSVWGSFEINGEHQGGHKGSGDGVHNPFLLEALLIASIEAVEDEYGLAASPSLDMRPQMTKPSHVHLKATQQ